MEIDALQNNGSPTQARQGSSQAVAQPVLYYVYPLSIYMEHDEAITLLSRSALVDLMKDFFLVHLFPRSKWTQLIPATACHLSGSQTWQRRLPCHSSRGNRFPQTNRQVSTQDARQSMQELSRYGCAKGHSLFALGRDAGGLVSSVKRT